MQTTSTERTRIDLLPLEALSDAATCLRAIAHPIRLRMIDLLMQGEFSVREIAELCEVKQHQACEHLRMMQSCGLLKSERRGQMVYYKIAAPQLPSMIDCVRKHCKGMGNSTQGVDE